MEPPPAAPVPRPPAPRRTRRRWAAWLVAGAAIGIGLSTHHGPAMKPQVVSGRASPKRTPSGATERWWQGSLTVTVDESLTKVWPDATLGVEGAFDGWEKTGAKLPKVAFDSRKPGKLLLEPDGENRIYYAPITLAGHENDLGITLQYTNPSSGEILEADIVINSRHPFALLEADDEENDDADPTKRRGSPGNVKNCSAKYDVASVLTHEIGHFLGLGEDMADPDATMYFSTAPCNVVKRRLKTDDVSAVSSLYTEDMSTGETAAAGVGHCTVSAPGRTTTNGGFVLAAVGVVLAVRRRRG
jgi:MYXO-CTERM domain-containing protein